MREDIQAGNTRAGCWILRPRQQRETDLHTTHKLSPYRTGLKYAIAIAKEEAPTKPVDAIATHRVIDNVRGYHL